MAKEFWKATGIRCLRTFITTILGCWTGGQLVTEIDWKTTFISAASATIYIFLLCVLAGIPEVDQCYEMADEEALLMMDDDENILDDLDDCEVLEDE